MASRPLIIASLLGASVGVPYVASHATKGIPQSNTFASPSSTPTVPQIASTTAIPVSTVQYPAPQPLAAPLLAPSQPIASYPIAPAQVRMLPPVTTPGVAGYVAAPAAIPTPQDASQFTSVAQVLRFDVSKDWVCRTWPRKSTGPTDVGLFAIRVPLVMGTQMSSLVGALTYYFNAQDQVEHISFRGRTGDTTQLVQYLTQSYQFKPVAAPTGEKVFQVANGDAVVSELRLHPEAVLNSNLPQQSVSVELEFARPGSQRVLPPHGPTLQLPQVDPSEIASTPQAQSPSAQNPASSAANATSPAATNTGGYWDQVHYATQNEQSPLFDRRWPQ